jgi:hypothetical protein
VPGRAEQRAGRGGQGAVPVCGARPTMPRDLEALAIAVGALEAERGMALESSTRDGGEGDLRVPGGRRLQKPSDFCATADGGETVGCVSPQHRQRVPVPLEDVLGADADAAVTAAHGRGGEGIDVFAGEAVMRQLLCRNAVGGCMVELRPQADVPDRRGLGPFARATEWESRKQVLTQWGHERSPC